MRYLLQSGYDFLTGDVFAIISYVLITSLCFTLHTSFAKIRGESKNQDGQTDIRIIRGLIMAPIQAVIIGLITILPRYNESGLTDLIGGTYGFVAVVATLIGVLVLLYFIWERMRFKAAMKGY